MHECCREEAAIDKAASSFCISSSVSTAILCGLFLLSIVVRLVLADYPKLYIFYLDELIYGSYAQSLLYSGTLEVLGLPMGFFRPVYSLLIAPVNLFSDPFVQQKVVALINAIVISTGIFPAYLLAKRLLENNARALLGAALYVCFSDLVYSQCYMTEVAALPLMLWAVFVFWELENSEKTAQLKHDVFVGLIFGLLMGLCFMCKGGAALVLPIAYFAYLFLHVVLRRRNSDIRANLKHAGISLVSVVVGFAIVFFVFHALIPPTSGDSADASNKLAGLNESADYMFSYYAVFYYLFAALTGLSFFPLVVTIQNRKLMEKGEARLFDFLIISLVVMAVVVAITITLRENYLENAPRAHMRYIGYLYLPLMLIFIRELKRKRDYSLKLNLIVTIAFVVVLFMYLFLYGGQVVPRGEICDDTTLKIFSGLSGYQLITVPVFAVLLIAGSFLLVEKRKVFAAGMACVLFGVNIANGVIASWIIRGGSEIDDVQQAEVMQLVDLQRNDPDAKYLLVEGWKTFKYQVSAANTFCDQRQTYYVDYQDFMTTYQSKGQVSWEEARDYLPPLRRNDIIYPDMSHIEYIITGYQVDYAPREGEYTEKYDFPELMLTVYKLADPLHIPATDTQLNLFDVKDKSAEQIFDEALAEGKITPEQREEFERQLNEAFPEDWTPDNK